jgi:tRNA(Arg) A34 adenosine deaminase TadA
MCLGAIYWARPDKIYYANTKQDASNINFDDQFIYSELDVSIAERKLPTIQLLRNEAQTAFTQWQESTEKVKY